MKISRLPILVCLAATLNAADLDPRLLRLIGPDAKYVSAVNYQRFANSKLSGLSLGITAGSLLEIGTAGGRTLQVVASPVPLAALETDTQPEPYRGARLWKSEGRADAVIDSTISLHGDEQSVTDAIDRWHNPLAAPSALAVTAQRLNNSYDAWFVVLKPLDLPEFTRAAPRSPRIDELVQAIDEIRAGIRFGSIDEAVVEVDAKSSDEATALAVFGRYLPAFLESKGGRESLVFKAADRVVSRSQGRTATLSLSIDESRFEEVLRDYTKRIVE